MNVDNITPSNIPNVTPNIPNVTPSNVSNNLGISPDTKNELMELAQIFNILYDRKPIFMCVCTGNTCRSATGQEVLSRIFGNLADISSAETGIMRSEKFGSPITPKVNEILNKNIEVVQINPSTVHSSRNITNSEPALNELNKADIIFAMDRSHADFITSLGVVKDLNKIIVLNISDPWRPDKALASMPESSKHGNNFQMIKEVVNKIIKQLYKFFSNKFGSNFIDIYKKKGFEAVREAALRLKQRKGGKTKSRKHKTKSRKHKTKSRKHKNKSRK